MPQNEPGREITIIHAQIHQGRAYADSITAAISVEEPPMCSNISTSFGLFSRYSDQRSFEKHTQITDQLTKNDFKPSKHQGGTYTDQRTAVRAATVPPSSCKGAAKPTTILHCLRA